jgi:large subunit ribosomal protein L23
MALFSKNTKKAAPKKAPAKSVEKKLPEDGRLDNIIIAPWLSEKALIGTENGVYVFEVPRLATKTEVSQAIQSIYKVTPRQVRMVNLPAKKVSLRTRRGTGSRARRHKAYVYLKKGETIQFA